MAHLYAGVDDPVAIIPDPSATGFGLWATAEVVDDEDDRDAGSQMASVETAIDRTNFLAWRMINIVDGHTTAYGARVSLANPIVKTGITGWTGYRPVHTLTLTIGSVITINPLHHDVWKSNQTITANTGVILASLTGETAGVRMTFLRRPAVNPSTHPLAFYNGDNSDPFTQTIAVIPAGIAGYMCSISFVWDGTDWLAEQWSPFTGNPVLI